MKRCPRCNNTYFDDSLNFCLDDGERLNFVRNSTAEETLVRRAPLFQTPSEPSRRGIKTLFAYLAFGLFALIAGGALVAYIMSDRPGSEGGLEQAENGTPQANMNGVVQNSKTPDANHNGATVHSPDPTPQQLTSEAVQSLLSKWESSQDSKNFAEYQGCYDQSFVGVKATKGGHSQTYTYKTWMADRRRMIAGAVNLNVDISNLRIQVDGDTAIAEFDQYYRSLKYSDWGPKEIKVKMTPAGPKIISEKLNASYPL